MVSCTLSSEARGKPYAYFWSSRSLYMRAIVPFFISEVFFKTHLLFRYSYKRVGLVTNKSLKALSPHNERKFNMGSGDERPLRSPGNFNKVGQAKTAMHRLTKLKHRDCFRLIGVRYQPGKDTSVL